MAKRHQNLFERGSGPWSVKRYKEVTLTRLLSDLSALEERGLERPECDTIKAALNRACTIVSTLPKDSFFLRGYKDELEELRNTYENWNGDKNTPQRRREYHSEMLVQRSRMWKRFPRRPKKGRTGVHDAQLDLLLELEREVMSDLHLAFKGAAESYPDLFPSLKKEIAFCEKLFAVS